MFTYKNKIKFNYNFKRSINISMSEDNCNSYKLTSLTLKLIDSILEARYNTNSFALIGSFGTGKSAFLLFLDLLMNKDSTCVKKLKENREIFKKYNSFIKNKKVFVLKFTGEHLSFREFLKNSIINNYKELTETIKYLRGNDYTIEEVLNILELEIKDKGYSDIFFFFDEFGKLLSYGLNNGNQNDISDLQVFSEYANSSESLKLIITLHRNIKDYANNTMSLNYNEWSKIQGRFETIIFEYNSLELINIVSDSFKLDNKINEELFSFLNKNNETNINLINFKDMLPLHPFTTLAISKLFSKYFQNNRSIYSFLFSNEPYSFKEFINKERTEISFYSLSELYDYMFYLSRAYDVKIPDREVWYLSDDYINKNNFSNIESDIIKTISLIQAYKMESDIKLDLSNISFSLKSKYKAENIKKTLAELIKSNFLFLNPYKEYVLLNEANIDIYKEIEIEKQVLNSIDYHNLINKLISKEKILAKKFFVDFGNSKYFTNIFINDIKGNKYKYNILFVNRVSTEDLLLKSKENKTAIYVPIENERELFNFLKEIEALNIVKNKFNNKLTAKTNLILDNMIQEKKIFIKSFFTFNDRIVFYSGEKINFNSRIIQEIITNIFTNEFKDSPKINNYTFNHSSKPNVGVLRRLFIAMLKNPDKEYFDIKKYPAEKALYISVIKPAGFHKKVEDKWKLSEPTDSNFTEIWKYIKDTLKNRIKISQLTKLLEKEPYGLNENSALLVISLFVVINKNNTFIFRENTYKYSVDQNILINLIKAPEKFELRYVELTESEKELFKIYLEITNNFSDTEYTRDSVKNIISKLYGNYNILPEYARNTKKISKEAKNLRSAFANSVTPYEGLFKLFPWALGYDINNINKERYIHDFKKAFNDIVSSYKNVMIELALFISNKFKLEVEHYPYNNEFKKITELLSDKPISLDLKSFLNTFINTDGFKDYINGVSIIINEKLIDHSYDTDIDNLKRKISILAEELLSNMELSNFSENKEVRRLKISLIGKDINQIVAVDNDKLSNYKEKINEIRQNWSDSLTKDEKLYILSELIMDEYE